MEIAKGVGIPLLLYKATQEGTNGFDARVLVREEIDQVEKDGGPGCGYK